MEQLQLKAMDIVLADPAVAGLGSSVGASGFNASVNRGRMFISLKPLNQRDNVSTQGVRARRLAQPVLNQIPVSCAYSRVPGQDLRVGGALRAIRNISSRCGAPISRRCKAGCRE